MANPTRLWFIRHGEVAHGHVGTFLGTTDADLSDLGRHQAAAIATYLEDGEFDAILSSPRVRARQTAGPLAAKRGFPIHVRQEFAEMDFGQWEGLTWQEIEARDPAFAAEWSQDPTTIACPGGEAAGAFAIRIQAALQELLEEFKGRAVALFGHAGTNRAILADILGLPYMESFRLCQDYGNINAAAWDTETAQAQLALLNLVPGPRSTDQGDGPRVD